MAWISNYIPYKIMDAITHPCPDLNYTMLVNGISGDESVAWFVSEIRWHHQIRQISNKNYGINAFEELAKCGETPREKTHLTNPTMHQKNKKNIPECTGL